MITVREKVIRQAIARIDRRLVKIKAVVDAEPLSELIAVRKKAAALHDECYGGERRDHARFAKELEPLAKEEKRLIQLFRRQTRDTSKLIEEQVNLEAERRELEREMFFFKLRQSRA